MFFRKDIFNAKPASLEAEIDHETTGEDEVKSLPSDTRPVYIIGDNALTCYLAAKITDAGHNVIVIAGKGNNVSLSTNGISLKEDSSLKLSRYKFTTSFWIKEEPKLVIITADAGHINSSLAAVSKTKIGGAPVLCFTPLKDINYLEAVVGGNLFRAFFDGYLQMENQQVFLYGRAPQIKICKNINWEKENPFPELFSYTGLNISYETDTSLCYWEFFAPYAVGSLLAALNNKNLFDITKDKQLRDQIPLLIAETAEIAAGEGLELNKDALIKKLYAVPMNYRFPLQDEINGSGCGETNLISSVLMNAARSGKTRFMDSRLNKILKQIYNLILV